MLYINKYFIQQKRFVEEAIFHQTEYHLYTTYLLKKSKKRQVFSSNKMIFFEAVRKLLQKCI